MKENDIKTLPKIRADKGNNDVIVKSNKLINAKYNFTLLQQRFLAYVCRNIRKGDKTFFSYQVTISSFCSALGIERKSLRANTRYITALMQKVITLQDNENAIEYVTLLSYFKVDFKANLVTYRFDEAMSPLLLDLKSKLTKTNYKHIMNFKSTYTIRFYEIIEARTKQFERYKNKKLLNYRVDLQELKEQLVGDFNLQKNKYTISKSYNNFAHFRVKVLEVAQKELTERNDYTFNYEVVKESNKVVAVDFEIIRNKSKILKDVNKRNKELFAQDKSMQKLKHEQIRRILDRTKNVKNMLALDIKLNKMFDEGKLKLDKDIQEVYEEYTLTLLNKRAEIAYNKKYNIND